MRCRRKNEFLEFLDNTRSWGNPLRLRGSYIPEYWKLLWKRQAMTQELQRNESTFGNGATNPPTSCGISTTSEAIEKVKEQIRELDEQMKSRLAAQTVVNTNILQSVYQDIGKLSDRSTSIMTRLLRKSRQILARLQRRGESCCLFHARSYLRKRLSQECHPSSDDQIA
jgi:hypothetical protein